MPSQKTRVILKQVLKKIKPSLEQRKKFNTISKKFLEVTNNQAAKYRGKAIIAGSLTRDTWLPSKNEFDVFIVFPGDVHEEDLEKYGLEIGKKVIEELKGSWRIEYAQHPYVRGKVGDVEVDIVPCYEVRSGEEIRSAVDRTPFHVKYLDKKFPRQLSDDVRLLKTLLKVNGIYGADTKTEGFSGYICELLVIDYGRFVNVLRAIDDWKPKEIIDIEKYWKKEDYKKLKTKFKDEILIIIDPVDKNRNAAAAISAENFYKLKKVAEEFLKNPSSQLFSKKPIKPLKEKELKFHLQNRGTELFVVRFGKPDVVPDILWPQLRRATKRLEGILREYEFKVHRSDCWSDEKDTCVMLLEMEISHLPLINEKIGPHIWKEENSRNFIKKYQGIAINGPYIHDNTWRVEMKREWKSALGKLKKTLNDKENILRAKGLPTNIAGEIVTGFKVFDNEKITELLKNREFGIFLRRYFEKEKLNV